MLKKIQTKWLYHSRVSIRFLVAVVLRAIVALGAFSFSITLVNVSNYQVLGIVMTIISVLTISAALCRFGTDNGLLRFGSVYLAKREFSKYLGLKVSTYTMIIVYTAILSLLAILLITSDLVADFTSIEKRSLVVAALVFPPFTLLMTQCSILKVLGKPYLSPIYEVGFVLALASLVFFVAKLLGMELGVYAAMVTISLSVLITIGSGWYHIHRLEFDRLPRTNINRTIGIPSEVKKCLPNFALISALSYTFQWGAVSLVTVLSNAFESGVFAILSRLAVVIGFGSLVVNTLIAPKIATLYETENVPQLARLINKSVLFALFFAIFAVSIMYIFHQQVFSLLDLEPRQYGRVLVILVLAQALNVTAGPLGLLLNMTGYQEAMKKSLILSIFLLIITCVLLVPGHGALGGAIAFLISMLSQNAYVTLVSVKRLGIFPLSNKVLR